MSTSPQPSPIIPNRNFFGSPKSRKSFKNSPNMAHRSSLNISERQNSFENSLMSPVGSPMTFKRQLSSQKKGESPSLRVGSSGGQIFLSALQLDTSPAMRQRKLVPTTGSESPKVASALIHKTDKSATQKTTKPETQK
eukprot:c21796_g1_i3.p1 GENE.c21796_g1_i3~~c21796_g1_i3.p1  ORF type:complete len:138 (+),score=41.85 c21796_g1_i3:56-469(+)